MAGAKIKEGLDYFPLSTRKDNRFKIIRALHGCEGHVILETLLQDIHGDKGYYVKWSERLAKIFASENAFSFNLVIEVVKDCLIEGIFDEDMFGKFQILTSEEIQKVWINVVKERKEIVHQKEFLLIDISSFLKKNNQEDLSESESPTQIDSETTLQNTLNSLNRIKDRINSIYPPFNGEENIINPSGNTISKQVKQVKEVKEVKQREEEKEFKQEKKESEAFNFSLLAQNIFPDGEITFMEKKMDGFFQIKKRNTGFDVLEESFSDKISQADPVNTEIINQEKPEYGKKEKQENGKREKLENFWEKFPEIDLESLPTFQIGNNCPDYIPEIPKEPEGSSEKWEADQEKLEYGKAEKPESGKMEKSGASKQEKSRDFGEKIPQTEKLENFSFQKNAPTEKRDSCENSKKQKKLPHPARSQIISSWEQKFNQPYQSSYNGNVSINLIIKYLGKLISQNENEIISEEDKAEKISELWKLILGQWEKMDRFYQNKIGFESIAKYLPEIVNQIKNGFNTKSRGKTESTGGDKPTFDRFRKPAD